MKICIVAHFAYGAMAGGMSGHIGGVERQTSLMARWFAKRGYQVSMVTWDEGQDDGELIEGVTNIMLCKRTDGIPGLRFFYPRWTSLIGALKCANADIYYHNCAEYVTGQVALWCKINNKEFVFSVPSDPDCDPKLPKLKKFRERILYRYGLRNSSKIIVQTKTQQRMLKTGIGLDSDIVPMPCPKPDFVTDINNKFNKNEKFRVLWVGRISQEKRLEVLLDIAEANPELEFDVAGRPKDINDYTRGLLSRANAIRNVTVHGMVERNRMGELYQKAHILSCTSRYEGFPNVFLEAWSYGVPIVSTVDPDDVIKTYGLGEVALDSDEASATICKLLSDADHWAKVSSNTRKYFIENHNMDSSMMQFEMIFNETLMNKKKSHNK